MAGDLSADILEAMGEHERAAGLRYFEQPERVGYAELEEELEDAQDKLEALEAKMCAKCRKKCGLDV